MSKFSYSQIQMFKRCELQYRYKYIDKRKAPLPEATAPMVIWIIVHSLLERCYNAVMEGQYWSRQRYLKELESLRTTMSTKFFFVFSTPSEKEQWHTLCVTYAWTYYDQFFARTPTSKKVLSTEMRLNFSLQWPDGEQYTMLWFIDRVDQVDHEHWSTIALVDYKTWSGAQELRQSRKDQLTLYAHGYDAVHWESWAWAGFRYQWVLYAVGAWKAHRFDITQESMQAVESEFWMILNTIQSKYFTYMMAGESTFDAKKGPHCTHCPWKSLCPEWK